MALTLEDILSAPKDPDLLQQHLQRMGVVPSPPPPAPTTIAAQPAAEAPATVKPMTPPAKPQPKVIHLTPLKGGSAVLNNPNAPPAAQPGEVSAPNIAMPAISPDAGEIMRTTPAQPSRITPQQSIEAGMLLHPGTTAKQEGQRQYAEGRPEITALPGTAAYDQQKLQQIDYDKAHPWGGEISPHPGLIGKIGHIAAKIGNIAGNVVAPETMANIPGTEAYKTIEEAGIRHRLGKEQEQESESALRAAETAEAEARAKKLGSEGLEDTIVDPSGNLVGWKDKEGNPHSLTEENTPQVFKDLAEVWSGKKATPESIDQAAVDAKMKEVNPQTGKNFTAYEARVELANDIAGGKAGAGLKTETKSIVGADGKSHEKVFDITPGSPTFGQELADLGRSKEDKAPSVASELAQMKFNEQTVRGFDKDGNEYITSRENAKDMGLQHISKATEKEFTDAKQNYAALNDMGAKVKNLRESIKALDQGMEQRILIKTALSGHRDDYSTIAAIKLMTRQSEAYVEDVFSLREAALALPKQTTGGSRVSEPQAEALWNTIPGSSGDSRHADSQLRKFDENLTRLWKKVPNIEGQKAEKPYEGETGGRGGGGGATSGAPPVGTVVNGYRFKGGNHRDKSNWEKANK